MTLFMDKVPYRPWKPTEVEKENFKKRKGHVSPLFPYSLPLFLSLISLISSSLPLLLTSTPDPRLSPGGEEGPAHVHHRL